MKKFLLLLATAAALLTSGAEYKIANIKLILAHKKYQAAYDELKYHLELAAGKLTPGKDALEIIVGRAGDKTALRPGESRYLYKNGKLYQAPVREIENYRVNKIQADNIQLNSQSQRIDGISGDALELEVKLEVGSAQKTGVKVFKGTSHETLIYYDAQKQAVVLDRSNSGKNCKGAEVNYFTRTVNATPIDGVITLRIFLDNTSCEVFINGGEATLTANVYANEDEEGIEFYSIGGNSTLLSVTKYDINVK